MTMFSNTLYAAEEAAPQTSDSISAWPGNQQQQQQQQQQQLGPSPLPLPRREMAARTFSVPASRGEDLGSLSSLGPRLAATSSFDRLPARPPTGLRSARTSRASSGNLDSSALTRNQQLRLQRLGVRLAAQSELACPLACMTPTTTKACALFICAC